MGITGLIPFLEKATAKTNLSKLPRHSTAAIDSYCWLHKGAFACADQLARGETTDIHIKYCLKYVALLQSHHIRPILVFDGRHLPAKAGTEARRRESRATARTRAAELMRLGRTDEARQQLRRCVDITHRMALQLIQQCRQLGVDCIVAPYEADAQLAYLNRTGLADYVITEDSDLVLFGCTRVLFKLDLAGNCLQLDAAQLPLAMGCPAARYTFTAFRFMCIMSGCDYVDSLPGIGLGKACKFVLKSADVGEGGAAGVRRTLSKIPAYLNMRHLEVTADYEAAFLRAAATFQHMVVYDPRRRRLVRLSDPQPVAAEELEWLGNAGEFFDEALAWQLALGNVDPMSLERLDEWSPDEGGERGRRKAGSIWDRQGDSSEPQPAMKSPQAAVEEQQANSRPAIRFRDSPRKAPEPEADCAASEDLLAVYTKTRLGQQSMRAAHLHDPLERSPNLSRNPFGRQLAQSPPELLKSPTKICAANSSLLRQCSPVKRVEFERSPLKRLADRVKRTVVDGRQKVLSRFFAANRKEAEKEEQKEQERPVVMGVAQMEEQMRLAQKKAVQFYGAKEEAEVERGKRNAHDDEKDKDEAEAEEEEEHELPPAKKTCRTLFAEVEAPTTSSSQSSTTTIDLTQSVEDEETPNSSQSSQVMSSQRRPSLTLGKRKSATACRQPGQSRKSAAAAGKGKAAVASGGTQSRLSAFGFSKKSL